MSELLSSMRSPAESTGELEQIAWQIGVDTAGPAADDVDRRSRFPQEAIDEFRNHELLSALLPVHLGGAGATLADVSGAVRAVAFHCSASALVLAMHSIEASNLSRHGTSEALQSFMAEMSSEQILIANANSEVGIGGDVGRSICAIEQDEDGIRLQKDALAISYGEHADAIAVTARRTADSEQTDQVQAMVRRSDLTLERTTEWDALGLRGTCSNGFRISARIDPGLSYPLPFAAIASNGGMQAAAILVSSVWVGLAESAAATAHSYVRAAARRNIGTVPPAAVHLAALAAELEQSRSMLSAAANRFVMLEDSSEMESPGFIASVRNLKVSTSELAVRIATAALSICGIAGYKRDTPYSLDRVLRDAHGSLVMVSNDRYLRANAEMLIARKHL